MRENIIQKLVNFNMANKPYFDSLVSNAYQKIIKKITYDTYGNIRNETNEALKVPFGFAGGLYDHETKLS